ncbi:putative membrane protein [Synechococcus sp. WH 8103]|nr:putative membrane protein [Synechococcus sp. WH 8103]
MEGLNFRIAAYISFFLYLVSSALILAHLAYFLLFLSFVARYLLFYAFSRSFICSGLIFVLYRFGMFCYFKS